MYCTNHDENVWAEKVATVKACFAGKVELCGWLVEGTMTEDGERPVLECGSHAHFTDEGWYCEAGHGYVSMEARHAQGWEYADDEQEAANLAAAGVEPVLVGAAR